MTSSDEKPGQTLIDAFRRYAERLAFLRPVFAIAGVAGLGLAGMEIFGEGIGEKDYLAPALVLVLWSLVAFASIGLFKEVPPSPPGEAGFIERTKRRFARGFFSLLAVTFVVLTLAGLFMTYRLISLQGG
ncbi:MAG: hypothetical protein U5O39_19160 [Gammaproteobacteria bacterium]|nr:hypothetical protein [Gammaproteobacteria bacterium]